MIPFSIESISCISKHTSIGVTELAASTSSYWSEGSVKLTVGGVSGGGGVKLQSRNHNVCCSMHSTWGTRCEEFYTVGKANGHFSKRIECIGKGDQYLVRTVIT